MWGAGMAAERQERTGGEAKLTSAHLLQCSGGCTFAPSSHPRLGPAEMAGALRLACCFRFRFLFLLVGLG
jgi:hypothetical protein